MPPFPQQTEPSQWSALVPLYCLQQLGEYEQFKLCAECRSHEHILLGLAWSSLAWTFANGISKKSYDIESKAHNVFLSCQRNLLIIIKIAQTILGFDFWVSLLQHSLSVKNHWVAIIYVSPCETMREPTYPSLRHAI